MKPRNLRHRLEKASKLLVTVQKYLPDASCRFADEQGEEGHLIVHLSRGTDITKLGLELEGKGFNFSKFHSPWLGVITYKGAKPEQPSVILEVEIVADRLYQGEQVAAEDFSFKELVEKS